MKHLLPQAQCRQLVSEFFGLTHGGRERKSQVLQDLIQRIHSQGYQKGFQDAKSEIQTKD
jgi:hypothetical protein